MNQFNPDAGRKPMPIGIRAVAAATAAMKAAYPVAHSDEAMRALFKNAGITLVGARPEAAQPTQSDENLLPYVANGGSFL
jgi:hypothetical protein